MYAATNGKYTLFVDVDREPMNPRHMDHVGTMVCWHPHFILGDPHPFQSPEDFFSSFCEANDWREARFRVIHMPGFIHMPLYLLDHSGLSIQTEPFHDPWDSGQVGYVYCMPEKVVREFGSLDHDALAKARKCLEAEVEIYDQYLRGECYQYQLYDGIHLVDDCGGFYGDDVQVKKAIKECIPDGAKELTDLLEDIKDQEPDSYLLRLLREGVIQRAAF